MGAQVIWTSKTKSVLLTLGSTKIQLQIGSKIIKVNGKSSVLDVPAELINSRTFIPLRAVSETLGKKVFYSNGLIILSNIDNIINMPSETQLVDKLNNLFIEP